MGDLDLAIEASYTVLDVDPDNFRVQDNVEWYEYELEQMPTVAAPLPGTKKKTGQLWTAFATVFPFVCFTHSFARLLCCTNDDPPSISLQL